MGQRVSSWALEDVPLLWWNVSRCMVSFGVPSFEGEECSLLGDPGAGKRARFLGYIAPTRSSLYARGREEQEEARYECYVDRDTHVLRMRGRDFDQI